MKRVLLALFLLIYLASCRQQPAEDQIQYKDRYLVQFDADEYSQIVWEYVTELKHDHRLHLENALVCFDGESKVRLEFVTQQILELCEARALLVNIVEGLLDRLNSNRDAAASLNPFPLTADQLEIRIDFESYHGLYADPFYIGWVVLEKGTSYFYAFNLKNKKLDTWNSRSEPYSKSRSFVMFQKDAENRYREMHPVRAPFANIPERYIGDPSRAGSGQH